MSLASAHALLLGVEGRDREHRAKDLVGENLAARLHVGNDRGRVERARPVQRLAAGEDARALCHGVGHEGGAGLNGARVDERPNVHAVLRAAAHLHGGRLAR